MRNLSKLPRRFAIAGAGCAAFFLAGFLLFCYPAAASPEAGASTFIATKTAASRCGSKLKDVEAFSGKRKPGETKTTQFSAEEINSYLALDLSSKYHACLKSLVMSFEENRLQGVATIDFDRLGSASTGFLPKLISVMFSGTHKITANGQLLSKNGKANFSLERALFDDSTLPKFLVEEIISAVGRKQKPPFDPLRPSQMPYEINTVDVHPGYIIVNQ